jgi:YD repeat-containing protein
VSCDPDLEGLRDRVRRVMVNQTSRLRRDEGESVDRTRRAVTLNPAGKVTEREWDYASGASGRTFYAYDTRGRVAETVETGTNPDGCQWTFRRIYTYDDSGRLVEERHTRADGTLVRTRQPIYTADGRRIEEQQFEPRARGMCGIAANAIAVDGSNVAFPVPARARSGRVVYDVRGAPVEVTFISRLGVTVGKVVFDMDAAGRTSALHTYGDTGECCSQVSSWLRPIAPMVLWAGRCVLNGWTRWNLVRRGEWRTLAHTLVWGPVRFEAFTRYDAHGRRLEERHRFAGTLDTVETWKYDAEGRLAEHTERDHRGALANLEEYAYEVDGHGNWVRRTITRQRLPHASEEMIDVTERVIEYYD